MRTVPRIRIFLSSPGDVADERRAARLVIDRLRADPLLRGQVDLDAIAWDDPDAATPMLATMTPQEAINRGLAKPSDCDIVIVIFWGRMGTPLPPVYAKPDGERYLSGTEWEYWDAVDASRAAADGLPLVVVYRRDGAPATPFDDPEYDKKREQWERVQTFFASFVNADGSLQQGYNRHTSTEDFARQIEVHLKNLIKQVIDVQTRREQAPASPTVAAPPSAPLWEGSPFPGLRAFTPDDEPIYFGRGGETDALLERLRGRRVVAVVGASGSGKSSLVGAGLLPRLAANSIEGSKDWLLPDAVGDQAVRQWRGLRFTPGEVNDNPFDALAAKLAPLIGRVPREVASELAAEPTGVTALIAAALANRPAWAEALLFVDQFEELYTLCAAHHRAPFVALLTAVAESTRARAVLTLRADFYARCVEDAALAALLEAGTFPLAAPGQAALYQMITRPAERAGLDFEEGLAEHILDDTGDDPGALALLAYALDRLYDQSMGKTTLTLQDYQAVGGVQGAIGEQAEDAFARLSAAAQGAFASVFRELVEVDERGEPTRRRAMLDPLTADEGARTLIDRLTDQRLLVTSRIAAGAVVEVAHEALLRSWDRLRLWIDGQTRDLQLRRRLESDTRTWTNAEPAYKRDFVLLGSRLEEAERWAAGFPVSLDIRAYIDASVTYRAAQIAEDARRQTELQASADRAERQRRRARFAVGFAGLIIIIALIAGLIAAGQVNEAGTRVDNANAVLTPIPITLAAANTQVADAAALAATSGADATYMSALVNQVVNDTNQQLDVAATARGDAESAAANANTLVANATATLGYVQDQATQVAAQATYFGSEQARIGTLSAGA
ncbi:MAG: ATP-binding protein, partial [Chloroflexota bacterium]|nr:ATP-binding protein [Chloroflexota bacterium]